MKSVEKRDGKTSAVHNGGGDGKDGKEGARADGSQNPPNDGTASSGLNNIIEFKKVGLHYFRPHKFICECGRKIITMLRFFNLFYQISTISIHFSYYLI